MIPANGLLENKVMKKFMKSLMLMAAAAVAFAGCAKETASEQTSSVTSLALVKFNAEIPDYQTTKSTIDVNGLTFTTRWIEGDMMGIMYECEVGEGYNKQATYSNGAFSSELPESKGMWYYYSYYPYQTSDNATSHYVDIPFGAERVQNGNDFNSVYDIMCAEELAFEDAEQGKTDDGNDISFSMVRQTALLYFHFTSPDVDEALTKATLSVEGDPIAADTYSLYYYGSNLDGSAYGTSWTSGESQSITLTFTNAPSSKDFTLWFNMLPYVEGLRENGVKNMKLVVETENKTLTLTAPAEEMYLPGYISKIEKLDVASTNWKDKETPTPPATTPVYEKVTSALTDWSGDYLIVYEDGSVAFDGSLTKLDASSNVKSVTITDGKIEATDAVDAASFTIAAVEGGYSIQSASGVYIGQSTYANGLDEKTEAQVNTISYADNTPVICGTGVKNESYVALKFNKASDQNRFRYYKSGQEDIALYKRSESLPEKPYLKITEPESLEIAYTGGTTDLIGVSTNQDSWTVARTAGDETFTASQEDGGFKVSASANTGDARESTFTVTAGLLTKTVKVTQAALPSITSVTTAAATDIATTDGTTATLNGSYALKGIATVSVGFEYRESSATDWTSVEAVSANSFFCSLTGLTAGTGYSFRAWASLDAGTTKVYGDVLTFTPTAGATCTVTYDFTKISGFSDWDSSYSKHEVEYTESVVTFASANKQGNTITDCPVTKGKDVTVVMKGTRRIQAVKFVCKQWNTKSQTITLYTSTDGGINYTSTSTKSSNFTLSASDLATDVNAVKFTFSNSSNQVGISSLELTYTE